MKQAGFVIPQFGLDTLGLKNLSSVRWNLSVPALYEEAIRRGEGCVADGGALVVNTGVHTGRSPKDKFIVKDAMTERTVWWDNNGAITLEQFDRLHRDFLAHAKGKELFCQDLYAGADPRHRLKTRVLMR